jgi:GNAT superfamily N-acetyltransferase
VSWEPLNLALIEERPPVRPTLGGLGLVYPGKRHVFSGPQEAAKTLAAYAIALEVIRQGGIVVLVDLEMGPWDARDRLRELGASAADFERLLYVEPDRPASEETILDLIDLDPTLVVIDAAAGAYDLQGLDDNKRADVERFARVFVRSFWWRGVATILLDHVVKNADSRGKYAIGSERKVGGADVHLGFEVVTPLARGRLGLYKLTTHKDRGGWLPRPRAGELELRSDPETHAISWTFRPPANVDETDGFRPTALMERVSRYLEEQSEPISRTAIEEAVTGKVVYVRIAIDCLVREGFASETSGARGARLVSSVHPYRDGDPVPGVRRRPRPDPVPAGTA